MKRAQLFTKISLGVELLVFISYSLKMQIAKAIVSMEQVRLLFSYCRLLLSLLLYTLD
jgi:hypothetical protein